MFESLRTRSCVKPRTNRRPTLLFRSTLLSLVICLSVACAPRHATGVQCPAIEMSAVADTQTDSTKVVTLDDTTPILVSRSPLVTTADITGATASQTNGAWILYVTVTDDAAERVHEFTEQHVGAELALAVDGKVHGTPLIAAAINGDRYQIDGLDRAGAEQAATAISSGCHR